MGFEIAGNGLNSTIKVLRLWACASGQGRKAPHSDLVSFPCVSTDNQELQLIVRAGHDKTLILDIRPTNLNTS